MKTTLMIILALIMLGCGEDDMATIGEEVGSDLNTTNVTDDTQVFYTVKKTVSSDKSESSFIIKNGTLWSTGLNNSGQLGLGDTTSRNVFTDTGVADVRSVSTSGNSSVFYSHTFIIKSDNTLWSTGYNSNGQLGLGDTVDRNTFTDTGITNVRAVFCGYKSTFIIKLDGTLWSVGSNGIYQLGLGDTSDRNVFTDTGVSNILSVSVGEFYSTIIKLDGTLWSVGSNFYGQLGLADNTDRNVFTDTGIANVRAVSAGRESTILIKSDNTLWSTGRNNNGQLGLGDIIDKNVFTSAISSVSYVSVGDVHSLLVKTDGTLWSTGRNNKGQLGIGDNIDKNVFTDTGVTGAIGISAGEQHSLVVKSDNTLWSTGYNSFGQLGLADNTDRNVFTDTLNVADDYSLENTYYFQNDIVKIGNYRHSVSLLGSTVPSIFISLAQISVINELKPFDGQNITPAISSSTMTYTITGTEEFNAFTLAKVLATSVTYTFRDELANIVKTATSTINLKRDENGILSDYPTTVVFYADQQMPIGSTVEISLTYSDDIELGDFTLNNMVDSGFTNLAFSHGIQDFNDYTPDAWGNIPESIKAIVTTFQVSMDVPLTNYDYAVSFNESIAGKNVTIDASDSNGAVANGSTIFGSLIRRVRITNPAMKSNVKDEDLGKMATLTMKAQEIA